MNSSKNITFLILGGTFILGIFIYTSAINILPNNSSDSYFSINNTGPTAIIENITFYNGNIMVSTDKNDVYICAKQTKTTPSIKSICWKKVIDNKVEIPVYEGKKYYIWLKDENNNISNYKEFNSK